MFASVHDLGHEKNISHRQVEKQLFAAVAVYFYDNLYVRLVEPIWFSKLGSGA